MDRIPPDWIEKASAFAYFGALGAFAALVGYLVQLARTEGTAPSAFVLIATVVTGFYLGMLFGGLVPQNWDNRDAIVLLVGATGMKGFEIATKTVRESLPDLIRRVLGSSGRPPSE